MTPLRACSWRSRGYVGQAGPTRASILTGACFLLFAGMILWAAADRSYYPRRGSAAVAVHRVTADCYTPGEIARRYGWQGDWRDYMTLVQQLNGWDRWPMLYRGDELLVLDYRSEEVGDGPAPSAAMERGAGDGRADLTKDVYLGYWLNARGRPAAGCTHLWEHADTIGPRPKTTIERVGNNPAQELDEAPRCGLYSPHSYIPRLPPVALAKGGPSVANP